MLFRIELLIIFVSYMLQSVFPQQYGGDDCLTPNHKIGICVKIRECPMLMKIAKKSAVSKAIVRYLDKSKCDVENPELFVCCSKPLKNNTTFHAKSKVCGKTPVNHQGIRTTVEMMNKEVAENGAWPWIGYIIFRNYSRIQHSTPCAGSLINEKFVLTAGHCLVGPNNISYDLNYIRFIVEEGGGSMNYGISKIFLYPKFFYRNISEGILLDDIGLVRLNDTVLFSKYYLPVCLPIKDFRNIMFEGKSVFIVGWGFKEPGSYKLQGLGGKLPQLTEIVLQQSLVTADENCPWGSLVKKNNVCISSTNSSGMGEGAVMMAVIGNSYHVVGILSTTLGSSNKLGISLFTKVNTYIDFILNVTKTL